MDAIRRSRNRPGRPAGVRGWMHKDVGAYPRIGKNEADGVVDASRSDLVGIEEQRRNGEPGSIGTAALISTSRRRIDAVEIPNCEKVCNQSIVNIIGLVGFVKFAVAAVSHDEVTVALTQCAVIA